MNITIWENFNKRRNATKQPTGGTTKSVALKDGADIENPTFILNDTIFDINYVQAFGKYYFARCRNLDGHHTEIICTVDPMATYKSNISAYTGLVEYTSASNRVDITDPRNTKTLTTLSARTDFSWGNSAPFQSYPGTYILSVISNEQNGVAGPNKYFALDSYGISQFSQHLFTNGIWDEIVERFTSLTDSLVSLIWLPIKYDSITGASTSSAITVGDVTVSLGDAACKVVTNRIISLSTGSTTLTYPEWATGSGSVYRTYLGKAPYLTSELYLPFVGWVGISDELVCDNNKLTIWATIDVLTGDIVYEILQTGNIIASFSGNCATKMPISSASYDAYGVVGGVLSVLGGSIAAGMATGGVGLVAGLTAAAAGGVQALKSTEIHTMTNGSISSAVGAALGLNPKVVMIANKPANAQILSYQAELGMPYYEVATLGNLSGYIKCHNASISLPGTADEIEAVNSYLNNGFYLD